MPPFARVFFPRESFALLRADSSPRFAGGSNENMIAEADSAWVRYKYFTKPQTLGHKHNVALAMARGRVAVLWSEYDMYGPDRIEAQARPIIAGNSHGE